MKENLFSGVELYADRKRQMNQMTDAEAAEYRAEMASFLAEQGMPSNTYSLANLRSFSSNDVAALAAVLSDAKQQGKNEAAEPAEEVVRIPSQFSVLKLPVKLENQGEWIGVFEALQIKWIARNGTNTTVVFADGTAFRSGDVFESTYRNKSYAFVVGSLEGGRVTLGPLVSGVCTGRVQATSASASSSLPAQDAAASARTTRKNAK